MNIILGGQCNCGYEMMGIKLGEFLLVCVNKNCPDYWIPYIAPRFPVLASPELRAAAIEQCKKWGYGVPEG